MADNPDLPELRYAESEPDMTAIHQFLLVVAEPVLQAPVDPLESLQEIIRVVRDEMALMLVHDGHLVGTMGVIQASWWYNPKVSFLTDRWHFTLPDIPPAWGRMLLDEAVSVAERADLKFIHNGKIRRGKTSVPRLMPRVFGGESDTVERQGA